jgi:transposase
MKRAILHRKNALFYKTDKGAEVGDTFMSAIHTCALVEANPFEYLNALQENVPAGCANPAQWMPWNWRERLSGIDSS